MYTPKANSFTERDEIVAFMRRFSFATVITTKNNYPTATHLPFLVNLQEDGIVLASHFAKANNQWREIEDNKVLVIFNEPHAYISPKNYENTLTVPTWNYISVHAYGTGRIVSNENDIIQLLEHTIDSYETSYQEQWLAMPIEYRMNLIKGIVGFEIVVDDLQGKKKLSQNKSKNEQNNIIETLSGSNDTNAQLIAEYMKQNKC